MLKKAAIVAIMLSVWAGAQVATQPSKVGYCDVVVSPAEYNGKTVLVEVILSPGYHSLFLYGESCAPREGFDVTTEAVLPNSWESLANGKKLRGLLKHGREAKVSVIGTFEGGRGERYGVEGQKFRFSISRINSVASVDRPAASHSAQ